MSKKKKHDVSLPDAAELLAVLATLDEVSARIPTATEHDAQVVPPWCELVLELKREPDAFSGGPGEFPIDTRRLWLRRHDGELIIEVLDSVLHPQRNLRGVDAIWAALDAAVDRIQARVNKGKDPKPVDVGEARGLAMAVAMYTNPRYPDTDEVRAEAMTRWDTRNGLDEA